MFITDPGLITIVSSFLSAVPPTITAVAGIWLILQQGKANAKVANKVAEETKENTIEIVAKTKDIHELSNGSFTKVTEELKASHAKIVELEELINKNLIAQTEAKKRKRRKKPVWAKTKED